MVANHKESRLFILRLRKGIVPVRVMPILARHVFANHVILLSNLKNMLVEFYHTQTFNSGAQLCQGTDEWDRDLA